MTTKREVTEQEIAGKVRRGLEKHQPSTVEIEVLDREIYRVDDWWHIPVRPRKGSPKTFEYYTILSDVEGEIEEANPDLNIILVPAAPEE